MTLIELVSRSEPWMVRAACRGLDPAMFFPTRGEPHRLAAAKAVCARCPVIDACLDYAIEHHENFGIFGGTSERERRRIRRDRKEAA